MSGARLCAISVDLDEIHHYFAIHGLAAPAPAAAHAVYDVALGRYRDFAAAERIPLTLFAVGSDLERAENGRSLRSFVEQGHEIGNHSFDHWYDLSRRAPAEMRAQIERASEAIRAHTGAAPRGFRAPGYVMSDALYAALAEQGVAYSSSLFPSPAYYFAKLAKLLELRLRGRQSRSIAAGPAVLFCARTPHRIGQPYWRAGSGIVELPIQVTPGLRLPVIGTSLMLLGPERARRLVRGLAREAFVNLELHGIDLLDAGDQLAELAPHQFDVRVPLQRKLDTLSAVVRELRCHGFSFTRLDAVAHGVA